MRFHQRSQISVLYSVCGPPVLAPDRERIRPPHIDCLPIVTCRGTATEGRILACIIKGYLHRKQGLSKKFDQTNDLIVFENAV